MKERLLLIIAAFLIVASCSKSSNDDDGGNGGGGGGNCNISCTGVAASFSANVNPIIQSTCATDATCHGSGAPSSNGPGQLLTYAQISGASAAIKTAVCNGTMPKVGSLTTGQKNTIICWVNGGAQPN